VTSLQPSVPRDLETICLKCLVKDPRNRYSTAGALADDLHRWLRGEPITARPANLVSRTWLWAKRKPALASALVLLVLAVGAGISGTVWGLVQAREQLAQRQAADRVDFELTEAFNCIGKARFGQAIRISERCAAIMEDLFRRNPGSPWFQWHLAACYDALGEAWRGLGAIDRSAAALERSIALHKAFLDIVPDSINVNRSYTHSLERLTAAYYLLPSSTQAVIDVMATRNDLHRRLSSSCERKRYEFQRIADNLEELGDYFLIQSKASEALDHYSRARQVVADHLQGAPVSTQFVAALDQRIDLVIRLLEGDDGIAVDLVKLLSSPELLILLQRQFQGRNDPVAVAAVSHQMVTHRDGYFATWAGARGFAWAAEAGPPGSLRAEYGRRCEDCLARLLLYSDEAAERVKSEPLFARYRHLWDSPR
jgi:tetratricopeptide (TPR) repeat protein